MRLLFRSRIRHPLYPGLTATPAGEAQGPCTAVAGTLPELVQAAARGVRARRAIFALHHPGAAVLTETERDALWQVYQVPLYVLLLDGGGRVLGYECEAQEGLHLEPHARAENGVLEAGPCPCGRPGPRLVGGLRAAYGGHGAREKSPSGHLLLLFQRAGIFVK